MRKSIYILILFMLGLGQASFSMAAELTVPADLTTDTLVLNATATPPTKVVSKVYYNDTDNKIYYCYNITKDWRVLGVDRKVATRIVSAFNSNGSKRDASNPCLGDGTNCINEKADFTCDGSDDQEMVNIAINSLPPGGGTVHLLEGTYNITTALLEGETIRGIVPHDNTALIGTGSSAALMAVNNAGNLNVINAQNVNRTLIAQLRVDGNNRSGSNNCGIKFSSGTKDSKISQVWAVNFSQSGISLDGASTAGNIVSNNHLLANGAEGISITGGAANNIIVSNDLYGNGVTTSAYGILLNSVNSTVVSCNYVLAGANGMGIGLTGSSVDNLISNNNVQESKQQGVLIDSGSRNIITYNMLENTVRGGILVQNNAYNNTLIENFIYNYDTGSIGSYYGIELLNNADDNLVSSNFVWDPRTAVGSYGLSLTDSTCDDNYLAGNIIYRNDSGQLVRDGGTGSAYTDKSKLILGRNQYDITTAAYSLNVTDFPQSYAAINTTSASGTTLTVTNGKAAGDILILDNSALASTRMVRLNSGAGTNMRLQSNPVDLYRNDTLSLIWDGSVWAETGYSDNP